MTLILSFILLLAHSIWAVDQSTLNAWNTILHVQDNKPLIRDSNFLATLSDHKTFNSEEELNYWSNVFEKEDRDKLAFSERSLCRFPARYWFLSKGKLLDPLKVCPKFSTFYSEFNSKKVYVVFSSYYAQSSASLFGHTFLRFSRGESRNQELLDWGVSYAAENQNANFLKTFYQAFWGSFKGAVQIMPYYYKVREYNDFEFRPLWSYPLNLTPDEIKFLLFHLWELTGFNIKYQYLTHNCSSLILDILAITRPETNFRNQIAFYHIPIDIIKVLKKNNLIGSEANFRPSLLQQWSHLYNALNIEEKKKFNTFLKSKNIKSLNDETKLLDVALDYYDYKFGKELAEENSSYSEIKNNLLIERSKKEKSQQQTLLTQEVSPDKIHSIRRMGAGLSYNEKGTEKIILNYRFAYHDPMDSPQGITSRMKINFMQTDISYIPEVQSLHLEKLNILDVASWSNSPPLDFAWSYEFKTSWERWVENQNNISGPRVDAALGFTFELSTRWYLATMLENLATYSDNRKDSFSNKMGPQVLLHFDADYYRMRIIAKKLLEITGYQDESESLESYELNFSFNLDQDQSIGLKHVVDDNFNESSLNWYKYF